MSPKPIVGGARRGPRAAADAAWAETVRFASVTRWFRPVTSAQLNDALRSSHSYADWRRACGEFCRGETFVRGSLSSKALRMAFDRGVQHAWPAAGKRRVRDLVFLSKDLWLAAYVLGGVILLEYVNFAANEFFVSVRDVPDDDLNDAVEQQFFERWKAQVLRRRVWPALPRETVALLVRPVIELTFHAGMYLGWQQRWPAAWPGQVRWRFRPGRHCRRHDADQGLTAPPDAAVWLHALPPRAYFCDCTIEVLRNRQPRRMKGPAPPGEPSAVETAGHGGPTCVFFAGDRRSGPSDFLRAYMARMRAECHDDDADCGDDRRAAS